MKKITYPIILLSLLLLPILSHAQNTDPNIVKATKLMQEAKFKDAVEIFEIALAKDPNNLALLYNTAYCYLNIGRTDIATRYLQRFINRNPKDADAYNLLGLAHERTGYPDSAIAHYSNAIQIDKNYFEAYFNRGRIHLHYNRIIPAKLDFTQAKRNKIVFPDLYYTTGEMYYELQQFDSAIIDLEKILSYYKDDNAILAMLGDSYLLSSQDDDTVRFYKSIDYYTRSLAIEENINVLKNRAFVFDKLQLNDHATKDRKRLEEIQLEKGFNPMNTRFRKLTTNSIFTIDLPAS